MNAKLIKTYMERMKFLESDLAHYMMKYPVADYAKAASEWKETDKGKELIELRAMSITLGDLFDYMH